MTSAVAIAVVNGIDRANAMPPTADLASSTATPSFVSTSPSERPATLNNSSSGSDAQTRFSSGPNCWVTFH